MLPAVLLLAAAGRLGAQQVADTAFHPPIARPMYAAGAGPVVALDEAHHDFHTVTGRYAPFAALLRRDGYRVVPFASAFSDASLRGVNVLVIANPLNVVNAGGHWTLPTPSAFTAAEIAAVRRFVTRGGALLLIADHMPFAGAAEALGAAFGLHWTNGFAHDSSRGEPLAFRRGDGTLADHPITRGRDAGERIDSVRTFTGSAFRTDDSAAGLLNFGPAAESLDPRVAWQFDSTTVRVSVAGWHQGAALRVGRGRVAAFGEAAMFSAQLAGPNQAPMGRNAPVAAQNPQFLLNVLHWLSGRLD